MGKRVVRISNLNREVHRSELRDHLEDAGYVKSVKKHGKEATVVSF